MTDNQKVKKNRITSIDALRAVTLLGIIMVHAFDGFGHGSVAPLSGIDEWLNWFIKTFLVFIGVYLLQAVFSYIWLQHFRYGPMEYLWRAATERRFIKFRI